MNPWGPALAESNDVRRVRTLALWVSRSKSLRNLLGLFAFTSLLFAFEFRTNEGRLASVLIGAVFVTGAIVSRIRPFATCVAVTVLAAGVWGLQSLLSVGWDLASRSLIVLHVLCLFWPVSYCVWALDLGGADRWIRGHREAWMRARRDRSSIGLLCGDVVPAGAGRRRTVLVLRALATPLGGGLLALEFLYLVCPLIPGLGDWARRTATWVGL